MFSNLSESEESILALAELSRIEKLCTIMVRRGLTFTKIAERLDITAARLADLLKGDSMPPNRHAELLAIGFISELLPPPVFRKAGPKPKAESASA